jgi:hypothetical protein
MEDKRLHARKLAQDLRPVLGDRGDFLREEVRVRRAGSPQPPPVQGRSSWRTPPSFTPFRFCTKSTMVPLSRSSRTEK